MDYAKTKEALIGYRSQIASTDDPEEWETPIERTLSIAQDLHASEQDETKKNSLRLSCEDIAYTQQRELNPMVKNPKMDTSKWLNLRRTCRTVMLAKINRLIETVEDRISSN